ncbi:MAG: amidase domain-containing protein [Bacillota bacterium]|nr:amidase domain-containing protein [Bacillota bacterium]
MDILIKNKIITVICIILVVLLIVNLYQFKIVYAEPNNKPNNQIPSTQPAQPNNKPSNQISITPSAKTDDEIKEEVTKTISQIFQNRNKALISQDLELIESIYDTDTKYATWAYEYEQKKMKYIHNWESKQGIKFTDIIPSIVIRKIKVNEKNASVNLLCSTEYKYYYENQPEIINSSRIGTYHILNLTNKNGFWVITKEWYKDPFGDSLNLDNIKVDTVKEYILSQSAKDLSSINQRRINTINYAKQYCGAAEEEQYGYKYNKKYRDYNSQGGDCANFASQTLFEGGKFKKNSCWNYDGSGATRSWLNADGFKSYMTNSGRASVIAYGSYEKVYKASYKLLPGDFVAYEKKGDINHISVVSGADSKGYALVTCHNSDRNNVPWDLGWSNKDIKFWLVHVNY